MPCTSVVPRWTCRVPSGWTCTWLPCSTTSSAWYSAGVCAVSRAGWPRMSYVRTATVASARSFPSFSSPKANRFSPTASSEVVISTCSVPVGGGASSAAAAPSRWAKHAATTSASVPRPATIDRRRLVPLSPGRLLHNDLPVLPRMRQADVVVVARLRKCDGRRAALHQHAGVPLASLHRRRRVREIADVGEGHRGPRLDANASRREAVFDVARPDLDRVDARDDRSGGPGDGLGWRRRPQRTQLSLQGEGPHRVTVGTALQLIAAGGNGDVLLAVHFIDHRGGVSPEARLEPPKLLTRPGIERQEIAIRLAAEDETAGGDRRATPAPDAVRRLVLPDGLVRLAVDGREGPAHRRADRRRLRPAGVAQSLLERVAESREGAGAHGAWYVEVARVRAVGHRRPVGAADPGWLHQHRSFPEGVEDTARLLVAMQQLGTLGHGRIADGDRLRLGRLLPGLLRHRALLDPDQGLAETQ